MKQISALCLIGLVLCSCESDEEKKTRWLAFCVAGDFTPKQCEVLYSLKESSDSANTMAAVGVGMSGAATGMAAGSRR
jgi:hypothetical protein